MQCSSCGFENPSGMRYCGQCATPLTAPVATGKAVAADKQPDLKDDNAVRRQLTVMFCDLVGSTALSQQLDPEDLREVMLAYRSVSGKVISRFGGHIAQFLGDGLLVYFGYPLAHEDDAQRAVRAGLGIIEAVQHLNPRLKQDFNTSLAMRVGIHTGLVVAGDLGKGEQLQTNAIIGETPNIAARLQNLAEPGAVVVGPTTYRLVQGFFHSQDLGTQSLKGLSQPMEVYRVLGESTARSRLDIAAATGLTPLVGREGEVAEIRSRWTEAKAGRGQVILLSGEPGIGKSRLAQMLKEEVAADPHAWLTPCQCLDFYQNSALYPVIDMLEHRALAFRPDDTVEQKRGKLEGWLVQYGFDLPETLPLFADLFSLPLGDAYPPLYLTPEQQKQKTLQALVSLLFARAVQQPLLFVVEDLHWADPSTLELLNLIVSQVPKARILALFTFRPQYTPPWQENGAVIHLSLNRLPHQQTESMIADLTKGKLLPDEVLRQLVVKTDGIPLFVEELTKMVLESEMLSEGESRYELNSPLSTLSIPVTLQDSLAARLDRLETVKEVVQLGATLGHEFKYEVLRAVSRLDEETLQRDLGRLVQAELLYQFGSPPQATYIFKHALIQDSAYQQMLRSKRQQNHQRIALVLEGEFASLADTQPELLAHHYTEAACLAEAIPYWHRAGRKAIERSANIEAANHLTKGLALLKRLETTPDRLRQELEFQTSLGPALMAFKGFAAPEVVQTWDRAMELCQQVGAIPQLFSALFGTWYYYAIRPEVRKGLELSHEMLRLAEEVGDATMLLTAHRSLGATLFVFGKIAEGLDHLQQGLARYNPQAHRSLAYVYGQDVGVVCSLWSAMALWCMGYPEISEKMSEFGVSIAEEFGHAMTLSYVHAHTSIYLELMRDKTRAKVMAEEGVRFGTEQQLPVFTAYCNMVLGTVTENGDYEANIALAHQAIAVLASVGIELFAPLHLAYVAEQYAKVGRPEQGLQAVAEGLAIAEQGDEHVWDPELYRIKGELEVMTGRLEQAEVSFNQSMENARQRSAKGFELRTAMSLSRLWMQTSRREQARQMLAEIYGWFTEGFGTADLVEAQALLSELADPSLLPASP